MEEPLVGRERIKAFRQLRKLEAERMRAKARMDYETLHDLTQKALRLKAQLEIGAVTPDRGP